MKKVLKVLGKTVKLIFIVFFIFLASLFFRQQQLPRFLVERICDRLGTEDYVIACGSASFGFVYGISLTDVKVYDRSRYDNLKPVVSVESANVWLVRRTVRLVGVKMPRLHDSYYMPDVDRRDSPFVASEETEDAMERFARFELPRIPSFTLELVRPDILGVAPERVSAWIDPQLKKVEISDFHLEWPDQELRMWLDGGCTLDFGALLLVGEVHGTARQEHIRPLLEALDLPSSYSYMGGYSDTGTSGFTEVPGPVPVSCDLRYDFAARDFRMDLDLHPNMGRYNDVRLQHIDGKLGIHTRFGADEYDYDIAIGPLVATDMHGRTIRGWMMVRGTNNLSRLDFDASSCLEKQDTLDIMGCLNRGTLDAFKCLTPPRVSAKGEFNCDDVNIPNNDFSGHIEVDSGEIVDQPFSDLVMDYRLKDSEIVFTNYTAKAFGGGDVSGWTRFHLPIADDDDAGLHGDGVFYVRDGRVAQIPLFLALTDALASNVPGIDKVVNQSEISCEYAISNGVFHTDHLVVQGSLFCIKITGSCDLDTGELDLIAHCTIMKEESALGKYLIQPVLWPFTKLLTEFHVTGNKANPKLRNTSVKTIGGLFKKVFN